MSGDDGGKLGQGSGRTSAAPDASSVAATPGKTTLVQQSGTGASVGARGKADFAPNQRQYDLFFHIHRTNLLDATSAMLLQARWPDPAEDAPFAPGGDQRFTRAVNAAIRSRIAHWDGHRLTPLLFPGNPTDAFRRFIAGDAEQMHETAWSPAFGDAYAQLVHQAIYKSLRERIGPRYRAALAQMMEWPEATDLIAGHPIDPIVAEALTPPGTVDRGNIAVVKDLGPPKLTSVTARWLGHDDPELWNFVEVVPASASVEDVAAALWKDPKQTTNAYALTKVGDVFRVAPGHARPLLQRLYPGEVVGASDSNTPRAQQLLALSHSKVREKVRERWAPPTATKNEQPDKPADAKKESKDAGESPKAPGIAEVMEVEKSIGTHLEKLRLSVATVGMTEKLAEVRDRRVARVSELATGDSKVIDRWLPILQFQHTQLLSIGPRIPPLVEKLLPLLHVPPQYLDETKRKDRERNSLLVSEYLGAANTSDDPALSTAILAGVLSKEKAGALGSLGDAQISSRQATREGVATKEGAARGSQGIDEDLTHAREDAMSGKNTGGKQYDEKKLLIRAGEISLRNRMNNVEQSIVMLREAAAAAGFSDSEVLRKLMPSVKPLPEVLAGVHDHLRDVDRAWDRGRAELEPQVVPQDAPEDWSEWEERKAGLEAAREAFATIAGDQDIGTFLREARDKIQTQRMINAVTSLATALLITIATGMGAAVIAEAVSGALIADSVSLAAQLGRGAIQVAINAPINSIVQLAISGQDMSMGRALLENALMDAFSRVLMFPFKRAQQMAMAEVKQLSQLPHVTAAETKAMASAASLGGTQLLAEGLSGMATMYAANKLVALLRQSPNEEITEPFALTVLQQGAAIGVGRFFAGRLKAWTDHRAHLAATRVANLPEMRALFSERAAFYADAEKLANHPSPEPEAGEGMATRDVALLRDERVILGRDTNNANRDRKVLDGEDSPASETKKSPSSEQPPESTRLPDEKRQQSQEAADGSNPATEASESIVLSGDDARMREAAKRAKPLPGYVDVVVHADADSFWVVRRDVDIRLDQRSLATYLRKVGLEAQKIRLIACEAGLTPFAVAQHLSNKLGVEVLAPTSTAWINGEGVVGVGPRDRHAGGWEPFHPKASSQDGAKRQRVPDEPGAEPLPGAPESVPPLAVHFDHRERYSSSNHAELQAKLGKPLVADPKLGDGVSVEVHRQDGLFGGYKVERVRVGSEARAQDVLAHAELIKQVERYNGLLGKLRALFDRLARFFGKSVDTIDPKQYPHGSRGWFLAKEVEKVRGHISQTHLDVANGQIDAGIAAREIDFLQNAETYFSEQLRTVDPKAFDAQVELSRPEPGAGTERAKKAGYKLPGEVGGEVPGGIKVDPDWYYYRETPPGSGEFELARKPSAPADAPLLQARVVNGQFQSIRPPESEPAPLLKDVAEAGGNPLEALYKPGMSMDRYAQMLENSGLASKAVIDGAAMHYYRTLSEKPRATIDDWRHAVKQHFKERLLEKMTDPKLDEAASYRMMREMVDGLASSDRGNLVEDWYRERYAKGAKRQKYTVERTSGENQGKKEYRVADMVQGGEIREIKDVDGPIEEGQLDAHLDAVRDPKLGADLGAKTVRYVFTKAKGALANETLLMRRLRNPALEGRFVLEVIDSSGKHQTATNSTEGTLLFNKLRGSL